MVVNERFLLRIYSAWNESALSNGGSISNLLEVAKNRCMLSKGRDTHSDFDLAIGDWRSLTGDFVFVAVPTFWNEVQGFWFITHITTVTTLLMNGPLQHF